MLRESLTWFQTESREEPTVVQRCLQYLIVAANLWTLAGAAVAMFAFQEQGLTQLKVLQIGCLLVGAAIYSIVFALHFAFRRSGVK